MFRSVHEVPPLRLDAGLSITAKRWAEYLAKNAPTYPFITDPSVNRTSNWPHSDVSFHFLEAVHKTSAVRRERSLSSSDIFRTRGVLQMRTSVLFNVKKNFRFFEILDVSVQIKGDKECWTSADKERGVNFVRTSFMNGHLCYSDFLCTDEVKFFKFIWDKVNWLNQLQVRQMIIGYIKLISLWILPDHFWKIVSRLYHHRCPSCRFLAVYVLLGNVVGRFYPLLS